MNCEIDLTNERYQADDRLLIHEHSGDTDDLPANVRSAIVDARKTQEAIDLPAGHWVIVVDDEVILSEFCPFRVDVQA